MRTRLAISLCCLILSTPAQGSGVKPTAFQTECAKLAGQTALSPRAKLGQLFDLYWRYWETENPEDATFNGFPGQNHRWTDYSVGAFARRKSEAAAPLAVLGTIRRADLAAADRLNFDLFSRLAQENADSVRFEDQLLPITQTITGIHLTMADTIVASPRLTVKDFEDIIARMHSLPTVIDQNILLMEDGIRSGITTPQIVLSEVPNQVLQIGTSDINTSPFLIAFRRFPGTISAHDQERLKAAAVVELEQAVVPAYLKLHDYLVTRYIPSARKSVGWRDLPRGKEWYEWKARQMTTTTLTPDEMHSIGLSEVQRIRAEMDQAIKDSGFSKGRAIPRRSHPPPIIRMEISGPVARDIFTRTRLISSPDQSGPWSP